MGVTEIIDTVSINAAMIYGAVNIPGEIVKNAGKR